MHLFHRDFGGAGKPPLVILHGLLGSSRNWQTVGFELTASHHVRAVDLRNHGQSPHADANDYAAMERDLASWMDERGLAEATLLGHSMGGKVAMALACHRPERVTALVVVDIAPRDYDAGQPAAALTAMRAIDCATLRSRQEAEGRFGVWFKDRETRRFLATNLERNGTGRFYWRVNLPVLAAELEKLGRTSLSPDDRYLGPTLFVSGGRSNHVREADRTTIRHHFPVARIEVLPDAGHNPHVDSRPEFMAVIRRYLAAGSAGAVAGRAEAGPVGSAPRATTEKLVIPPDDPPK